MTSRSFPSRHKAQQEEEDAAALKLGPEFNNAGCLLISEVKYLLENRDKDAPDTDFAKFNTTDSASAVREILRREPELTQFETAQIANLGYVVSFANCHLFSPSLVKIDDDRLQALLDEIQAMRKFQT
ncbi:HRDC-like protein [Russula vinacea]|nr:HRDC-like protein [Russula vinacea]